MNLKALTTGASVAALMTATPAFAGNSYNDHVDLWNTLQQAGVTTRINPPDCKSDFMGYYNRRTVTLVICQENSYPGGPQVDWTSEDLDTLRHEAHHVIQDCKLGGVGDMRSDTYFSLEDLKSFLAKSSLSTSQIESIIKSYAKQGAPEEVIIMELEAFAVARDVDASSIAKAVDTYCM